MNRTVALPLFVCVVVLCAGASASATAQQSAKVKGSVTVSSPTTTLTSSSSSIHYIASSTTTCAKGISAMGVYSAPHKLAYIVKGSKLNTSLTLPAGTYDTVVQEWDNCDSTAFVHIPVTVKTLPSQSGASPTNSSSSSSTSSSTTTPKVPAPAPKIVGNVKISAPSVSMAMSSVHYVANATSTCAKGVAAMGIYTAPYQLAYQVSGTKLDATINLPPGTYDTVVQEWDNCKNSSITHVPVTVQGPTTTLAAQTFANTSVPVAFLPQTNGNMGASNVSKVDIHSLLYPGANTQIYAELQPWFGDKRHMQIGYISWDPVQVEKQMEDMISRGVNGVVIDWYGPADPTEPTTLAWFAAAENHPGFKVLIMIDKGAVTLSPCPGCTPQQTMIYLTNYVMQHYVTSPAYATSNGRPLITEFDLDLHFTLDWPSIQAATSPNIAWIFENSGGFTHADSSGSYAWMNATSTQYGMDYLTNFYNAASKAPQEMTWGAGYKGFNDTLSSWTLNRVVSQQCGQTWLATFDKLNTYYNSSKQLPVLQLVTWNDYEEATEIETGIDNCLSVSASVTGSQLQWQVTGNENTVDHYIVYFTPDGQNLFQLNTAPVGTYAMNLSSYGLGIGSVYVQAVGKPSIKNQMSAAVRVIQ
ncbi:MAG TPA: endo-1,3-alpha-glucanase family glycosylhydrolase [Terriglobales bacterium]